ncbi:hypothetical protein H0G86_007036 [Trichoderma simmonsii]|uniref:Uncharacterized protein n=1 Tax=Trichoderma simmonsii TaxID=1491479 RepID=A0A8G0PFY4_9HYPO|nr:hypothetical protein H0G86_007036 [Trichoderma simmonsii]
MGSSLARALPLLTVSYCICILLCLSSAYHIRLHLVMLFIFLSSQTPLPLLSTQNPNNKIAGVEGKDPRKEENKKRNTHTWAIPVTKSTTTVSPSITQLKYSRIQLFAPAQKRK